MYVILDIENNIIWVFKKLVFHFESMSERKGYTKQVPTTKLTKFCKLI